MKVWMPHSAFWPPVGSNIALYKNADVDALIDRGGSALKFSPHRAVPYKDNRRLGHGIADQGNSLQ